MHDTFIRKQLAAGLCMLYSLLEVLRMASTLAAIELVKPSLPVTCWLLVWEIIKLLRILLLRKMTYYSISISTLAICVEVGGASAGNGMTATGWRASNLWIVAWAAEDSPELDDEAGAAARRVTPRLVARGR